MKPPRSLTQEMETRSGKRHLIRALMRNMTRHAVAAVACMPKHWDGHQIRSWLAEEFQREITHKMRTDKAARRKFNKEKWEVRS